MTPPLTTLTLFILLLFMMQGLSGGIRITKFVVPKSLAVGDSGLLECEWEDDGDHIYSLKWYQGIDEFYRWTPLETPEVKTFPTQQLSVDPRASQRGRVMLHNVTLKASGNYRCEVSGEAPKFKTSFNTASMIVVDLPDDVPSITSSIKEPFSLEKMVTVGCVSSDARPAPSLTFYLNNQPVERQWKVIQQVKVNASTGLETGVLLLKFRLRAGLAPHGRLQVKCVAAYPDLYWKSSRRDFAVDLPNNLPRHPGLQGIVYKSTAAKPAETGLSTCLAVIIVAGSLLR